MILKYILSNLLSKKMFNHTILTPNNLKIIDAKIAENKKRLEEERNAATQKREAFKKSNPIEDCAICCNATCMSDQLECGHYFHAECLKEVQRKSNKLYCECPICKYECKNIDIGFDLSSFEKMKLGVTTVKIDGKLKSGIYDKNVEDSNVWLLPHGDTDLFIDICAIMRKQRSR